MKSTLKICLLAIVFAAPTFAAAAGLGRLFFSPEQRAQLDYNYAQAAGPDNNSHILMLNGIVQQHGGKRTVWINGVPQQAGSSNDKTPESQTVQLPGKKSRVKLKVGQRVLLDTPAKTDLNDIPDNTGQ
ncbi:MAG: hypothetical protein WCA64_01410 [Gallionella sp.]